MCVCVCKYIYIYISHPLMGHLLPLTYPLNLCICLLLQTIVRICMLMYVKFFTYSGLCVYDTFGNEKQINKSKLCQMTYNNTYNHTYIYLTVYITTTTIIIIIIYACL